MLMATKKQKAQRKKFARAVRACKVARKKGKRAFASCLKRKL